MLETFMGAVVLMIAAFFLVFAYTSSTIKQNGGTPYSAKFARVDGLKIGNDIRMSGVKVGTVHTIRIDPETFLAKVEISVDPQLKLPKDTSAEIATDGLLGGKYLALVPGGDEDFLKSGSEIKYTQSSVSLEAMIGQLIFNSKKTGPEGGSGNEKGSNAHPQHKEPSSGPSPSPAIS